MVFNKTSTLLFIGLLSVSCNPSSSDVSQKDSENNEKERIAELIQYVNPFEGTNKWIIPFRKPPHPKGWCS